ncbi:Circadian input kinase A [hydrothermal vent metagenome]|uniref:histidine kinase n=1 Tax=hydrothermal vent metagenome TaxID=652676 RepID=A0A3B1B4X9_9ZZZZ
MSFRFKTILGIAAIEAVLLFILIWNSLLFLRASNEEELIKRANTTATLFATTTKNAVLSTDVASLDEFVHEVIKNPDIVYARVIDSKGVLAQAGQKDVLERSFVADHQFDTVDDGIYDDVAIIEEGGVKFGRVELGISIASIQNVLLKAREQISLIAIIEMALTALFSLALGTVLTRRILTLKQVSENVATGDLSSRVLVKGKDEIAVVGNAFNIMLDKLNQSATIQQQYQDQLEALNNNLEARVDRRTAELQSSNIALNKMMSELKVEKEEQRNLLEKLRQTQGQLLQSEKMASLGQLAAGVAHEINNPLGFVSSNITTLKRYVADLMKLLNVYEESESATNKSELHDSLLILKEEIGLDFIREDIQSLITESLDGTDRVKRIVKNLREFSHLDEADWQWVDIHDGLNSTLNIVNNEIKYKVEVIKEYGDLPRVECLASELNQVFLNLLVNAAQAIEDHGTITIHTAIEDNDHVRIVIADTGMGISEENITRIFDPFYTSKPVGTGTGLGLSFSYSIIQRHHGRIDVDSTEGEGTKFIIILPVSGQDKAAEV